VLTVSAGSSAGALELQRAIVATDAAVSRLRVSNSSGSGPTIESPPQRRDGHHPRSWANDHRDSSVDVTINCPSVTRV
jgi:hypothetical protein